MGSTRGRWAGAASSLRFRLRRLGPPPSRGGGTTNQAQQTQKSGLRVGVAEVARLPSRARAEVWRLPLHRLELRTKTCRPAHTNSVVAREQAVRPPNGVSQAHLFNTRVAPAAEPLAGSFPEKYGRRRLDELDPTGLTNHPGRSRSHCPPRPSLRAPGRKGPGCDTSTATPGTALPGSGRPRFRVAGRPRSGTSPARPACRPPQSA